MTASATLVAAMSAHRAPSCAAWQCGVVTNVSSPGGGRQLATQVKLFPARRSAYWVGMEHSAGPTGPVNWLPLKSMLVTRRSLDMADGTVPVRRLPPSSNVSMDAQLPMNDGIGPVSALSFA